MFVITMRDVMIDDIVAELRDLRREVARLREQAELKLVCLGKITDRLTARSATCGRRCRRWVFLTGTRTSAKVAEGRST